MNNLLKVILIIIIIGGLGWWFYVSTIEDTKPETSSGKTATFVFQCVDSGESITATFHIPNDDVVDIELSDGRKINNLPNVTSASGARYANADESFVFWNKGETAFILENGKTTFANCKIQPTN